MNPVDAAIEDALLHLDAELVPLGLEPLTDAEAALVALGFLQGVQFERTGDWRPEEGTEKPRPE